MTVDVAFISLTLILDKLPAVVRPGGVVVALVKPQFEAGRAEVGQGGVVVDETVHDRVVATISAAANQVGLERVAVAPSPITGAEGNQEFFLHLRHARVMAAATKER